jgi:hypothetical protein
VPRQSGKTTVTLAKKVWRLTRLARQLGPQRSTYTAQTRIKARLKLERDFADLLRASRAFREVPHSRARPTKATEWRLSMNNGSEHIQFGSGSFLQIDAPSRTGGHGDTLDDGTIDEAFAHEDSRIEDGMRPSMATRRNAQLWVISTAGDARSKYLWRKVLAGRAATDSGDHGGVCYVEYSADEDADPGDPATWWSCMPALGITIDENFVRGEWERAQRKGPEGIDGFRRAYLNQWPEIPVLDESRLIVQQRVPMEIWNAASLDAHPAPAAFFLTTSKDMGFVSVALAGMHNGRPHVELADHRPNLGWLTGRLRELHDRYPSAKFGAYSAGPVPSWAPALAEFGIEFELLTAPKTVSACAHLQRLADDAAFTQWDPKGVLTESLRGAQPKETVGGGWVWDWKNSQGNLAPIAGATGALWLLEASTNNEAWGFFE